jgi:hypothetical protein
MCKCYIEEKKFTEDIQFFETLDEAKEYGYKNSKIIEYKEYDSSYFTEVVYCVYIYDIQYGKSIDFDNLYPIEVIRAD